jgi:hypothetical protein
MLVMGSLGRVGIAGMLIGDTAESLIRSVHCSVLALKPPDFLCPVRLEEARAGPACAWAGRGGRPATLPPNVVQPQPNPARRLPRAEPRGTSPHALEASCAASYR